MGPVIQANGRLNFDDVTSRGPLYCVSHSVVTLGEPSMINWLLFEFSRAE